MPIFLIPRQYRRPGRRKRVAPPAGPKSRPEAIIAFAGRHRVITALAASAATVFVLGHHELAYLILAVNYDKIITAVTMTAE